MNRTETFLKAFEKCKLGSGWKTEVQAFEINKIFECQKLARSMRDRTYQQHPFREFVFYERGKARPIRAMHIADRVVQRAFCDTILVPALLPKLIHDNGASLKGKGVSFARKRMEIHLRNYWLRNGSDGYILMMDFSKFFDNIPHQQVLDRLNEIPEVRPWIWLMERMLKSFEYDVSYGYDPNVPFDTSWHRQIVSSGGLQDGSAMLRKSLGIGSQISQILGVWYPTSIDTWIKCVKGVKEYGRYMDDLYVIHYDKEFLKEIRDGVIERAKKMEMFINPKKTSICRLDRKFIYLKVQYRLKKNGKIWKRLSTDTFIRMRRRLKKYKKLMDNGIIDRKYIQQCYGSWKGMVLQYKASKRSLEITEKIYHNLFGDDPPKKKRRKRRGSRHCVQVNSRTHFRLEWPIREELVGKFDDYDLDLFQDDETLIEPWMTIKMKK